MKKKTTKQNRFNRERFDRILQDENCDAYGYKYSEIFGWNQYL